MKYNKSIFSVLMFGVLLISNFGFVLAQEKDSGASDQINAVTPESLATNRPSTQAEANAIMDAYIKQAFRDVYYTEKASVGEIKFVIKNKYLFTKQKIDFSTINYHIDKAFKFEGAQYSWKVKKGDKVLIEISNINKTNFFYNFLEPGNYQIEVSVNSAGVVKTGSINVDILDKISLDYRPLNPGKGDNISVATEIPVSQYIIEWKVDGKTVETNNNTISFPETKGYNQKYVVEAIAKDKLSGFTKYYGTSTIEIKQPEIRVALVNNKNNTPIDFADEISIIEPTSLLISSNVDNVNKDAKISYTYKINNKLQEGTGNSLTLDVDPNQPYKIEIVAKDSTGDTSVLKTFIINKDKQLDAVASNSEPIKPSLAANVSQRLGFMRNDRYMGLAVLLVSIVVIRVMSRHSKLVRE